MANLVLPCSEVVIDELSAEVVIHDDRIDLLIGDAIAASDDGYSHVGADARHHDGACGNL